MAMEDLFNQKPSAVAQEVAAVAVQGLAVAVGTGMDALFAGAKMATDAAYSEGMQHFVAHGAHELAAGLFAGKEDGFIMYQRPGLKDDTPSMDQAPDHGLGNQGLEAKQSQGMHM